MERTRFTVTDLKSFLERQPSGPIAETSAVVELLRDVWDQFDGGDRTKMQAYKLERIEEPVWDPPHLTFWIERHGETVLGSTNATVQTWRLDLDDLKASIVAETPRRVRAVDRRLDVKAIATKLVEAIIVGLTDERFTMLSDGKLKIEIGRIIPETVADTTASRRKRFRKELTALLKGHGWHEVRHNVYSRVDQATRCSVRARSPAKTSWKLSRRQIETKKRPGKAKEAKTIPEPIRNSVNEIATVRIELCHSDPLIWRQVEVPTSVTLKVLHDIIQAAMGWFDCHLWEFTIGQRKYGPPMDDDWGTEPRLNAGKARLRDVLTPDKTVIDYTYDFGDGWEHCLTVTDIRAGEPDGSYPRYVGGERNGPPEDCGGIPGFHAMLKALADPAHPDHADAKEWSEDYDPDSIDDVPIKYAFSRIANRRNAAKARLAKKK